MPARFVVIEGIDATGKSTVAQLLTGTAGLEILSSPAWPFDAIKQEVIECASPISNFLYFMASNAEIARQVVSRSHARCVMCLRYVWSTIAYHIALGGITEAEARSFWRALSGQFVLPSLTIYLTVSEKERRRRFLQKADPRFQGNLGRNDTFVQKLVGQYDFVRKVIEVPSHEIDTSQMSPQAVAEEIVRVSLAV